MKWLNANNTDYKQNCYDGEYKELKDGIVKLNFTINPPFLSVETSMVLRTEQIMLETYLRM